jgi:hypothetical protein
MAAMRPETAIISEIDMPAIVPHRIATI